jgi:uncharacterized membrane protein YdjX (TVP38/TMEM64 family)
MKKDFKLIIGTIVTILLFIFISYILQTNMNYFEEKLNLGIYGIIIYFLITILATVLGPISALPLLPVAVFLWGWKYAAALSVIGWTLGSTIAFIIARKYGINIVKKFVSLEKIREYESFIPQKDIFLGIILIRMVLPVDLLSYLLGIFSRVKLSTYVLATFIGLIPFAIILSYIGSKPLEYQIISFIIGTVGFLFLYYRMSTYIKKRIRKE